MNTFKANRTAKSSRQFMCLPISTWLKEPIVSSLQWAPQPGGEASVVIETISCDF